jgi:hypothetical protein
MRRLTSVGCLVAVALLAVNSAAFAQRGQGGGQGREGQSPDRPPTASPAKPSPGTPGSKGEAAQAGRGQSNERGATEALRKNPRWAESIRDLLPGQDLEVASSGFRNFGQFVAAAQVSKNTGIPFNDLKTRMVDRGMDLGQAIKDARPALDAPGEARKAETAARDRVSKAERGR